MYRKRLVCPDTYYIGASDRRLSLFENVYPLTNGMSYNSYLIIDEKTCLLDTVDKSVEEIFLTKLKEVLEDKPLDFLVVNHMEPDHAATLRSVLDLHHETTLVINSKALVMFKNFNPNYEIKNILIVNEGDTLNLGKHILNFVFAPMVHWPEVMVTYDSYSKNLFSADAFGTFSSLNGNLFAHEVNFDHDYLDETRRYYTNIVGKYGVQVQNILKKASALTINSICPLHGPIWRQDLSYILKLYDKWSRYEPESRGVLIVYGSIYGHSEEVANLIADGLALEGIKDIKMYDVSKTDKSYLLAETFKYSHMVICSSTYNMGIFTPMEEFLLDLKYHHLENRTVGVVENGSWAPQSKRLICEILSSMKDIRCLQSNFTVTSKIKEEQKNNIDGMCKEIAKDFPKVRLNSDPLFDISYGLFVLNTKDGSKNNGCIINTVTQVASDPLTIMIALNKMNYSTKVLLETKVCNISILNIHTPFSIIERFGFSSGNDKNKFEDFNDYGMGKNEVTYINRYTNSYISLKVKSTMDLGSHTGFVCEVTDKVILSNEKSLTYQYYQDNIKPVVARDNKKVGWVCKICGYVYYGEELPKDFICPICKHPASDFEKIQ